MKGPGASWIVILTTIIFGAMGTVVSIQQGWITAEQVAKYGMWAILGLIALFLFAGSFTKTKWDDIIVGYLLLLSIGGFAGTWLIDHNYVTQGYLLLGSLAAIFILLLSLYSKYGAEKIGRRFR